MDLHYLRSWCEGILWSAICRIIPWAKVNSICHMSILIHVASENVCPMPKSIYNMGYCICHMLCFINVMWKFMCDMRYLICFMFSFMCSVSRFMNYISILLCSMSETIYVVYNMGKYSARVNFCCVQFDKLYLQNHSLMPKIICGIGRFIFWPLLYMTLARDPTFIMYPINWTYMELIITNQTCIFLIEFYQVRWCSNRVLVW